MKKQKKPVIEVKPVMEVSITITDVVEGKRVEEGLFSDRFYDEISVFMDIDYEPGIPTFVKKEGQKEQVGYNHSWDATIERDGYSCDEVRDDMRVPKKPVFKIQDNKYKMLLEPNDDFKNCIMDLAAVLVEAQGKNKLYGRSSSLEIKDTSKIALELKYNANYLEEKLKRI